MAWFQLLDFGRVSDHRHQFLPCKTKDESTPAHHWTAQAQLTVEKEGRGMDEDLFCAL